jgi:hypothetical protein
LKGHSLSTCTFAVYGETAKRWFFASRVDANRYLNNAAAIQELVKGALEATIRLHTTKSTTVYYEIDGQIVEEWDA